MKMYQVLEWNYSSKIVLSGLSFIVLLFDDDFELILGSCEACQKYKLQGRGYHGELPPREANIALGMKLQQIWLVFGKSNCRIKNFQCFDLYRSCDIVWQQRCMQQEHLPCSSIFTNGSWSFGLSTRNILDIPLIVDSAMIRFDWREFKTSEEHEGRNFGYQVGQWVLQIIHTLLTKWKRELLTWPYHVERVH